MSDPRPTTVARMFAVQLTCCGRDDGRPTFATWQEADAFRESYLSGVGVGPPTETRSASGGGHSRSAIIVGSRDAATVLSISLAQFARIVDRCNVYVETAMPEEAERIALTEVLGADAANDVIANRTAVVVRLEKP